MQESRSPRPYDVATRQLIDRDSAAWLTWAGLTVNGPVQALDSEVSTVLAEVDKVLQVDAAPPWLAHLEIQVSRDQQLPLRLLQYHALLLHRHDQPVASVVVLLRPQADGPELDGDLRRLDPMGDVALSFRYRVIRVWQRSVEELLTGGLGILPVAPLADVPRAQLPAIVERMAERLNREAAPDLAGNLWASTLLLMGVRYDLDEASELLRGVRQMRESVTYQAILREGQEEGREEGVVLGARHMLLRLAEQRFGSPTPREIGVIESISDLDHLERLSLRMQAVNSWSELLGGAPQN